MGNCPSEWPCEEAESEGLLLKSSRRGCKINQPRQRGKGNLVGYGQPVQSILGKIDIMTRATSQSFTVTQRSKRS